MGIGSFISKVGSAFAPQQPRLPGINPSLRTPPFLPDEEAEVADPTAPPPAPRPAAAGGIGGAAAQSSLPTYRPDLDEDTQKYLDAARQPAPAHPTHGKARSIGEALTSGFLGQPLSERIWDNNYVNQRTEHERNIANAARPAMIRQKAEKGAADVSQTMASGALTGKQAANYENDQLLKGIERGGEIPDESGAPLDPNAKPRKGSTISAGGRPLFFPTQGQKMEDQAKIRREATEETYRPLPDDITKSLGLPRGFKVPPTEFDSYSRIYESKIKGQGLHFESHVDDITGNVTTTGRDSVTGQVKFTDTLKGVARKRPPQTQISILPNQTEAQSKLTGDEYIKSLTPAMAAQVRAISEGRDAIPSGASRSPDAQRIRNAVFQFDPSFTTQRAQVRRAFTTGPDGKNIGALNTAIVHLGRLGDTSEALQNGSFTPGNELYQWIADKFGSSAPTNFTLLKDAIAGEMAASLKGNATDIEIEKMGKSIRLANSPDQMRGVIQEGMSILADKANTYNERYHQMMPDDAWNPILPSSRHQMQRYKAGATAGHIAPPDTAASGSIPTVTTQAQFDALPRGAVYLEDGKKMKKP